MNLNQKKITLLGINFYPEDTAIGLYSSQMCKYLKDTGHDITVLTGFPYYPKWEIYDEYKTKPSYLHENKEGINIYRYKQYVPKNPSFIKRVIHLLDFTLGTLFNLPKVKDADVVVVIVPFTSAILLGWFLKKRTNSKLWIHVQDFEFDAAFQTMNGNNLFKKIFFRFLYKLEKWLFSKGDITSTISHSMIEKLKTKTSNKDSGFYFPNWIDTKEINPNTNVRHKYFSTDKFKILYSGNIGDKQDWDFFLKFAVNLDSRNVELVIVGDGSKRPWLENQIKDFEYIKYYSPVPYKELSDLLCSTDLHFLFQKEDVLDTVMPSKLLGMMASGKPSLVTGHLKSEVNKVLTDSGGGIYRSNIDIEILLNDIDTFIKDETKGKKMGKKARQYVESNFNEKKVLESFRRKIENC